MSAIIFLLHLVSASVEEQLTDGAQNHTLLWTPVDGWMPGPIFRGTSSILWSCIITILASIYTAIHVDIPKRHISTWKSIWIRISWSLITLLVPEMTLRKAYIQYREAAALIKHLNSISAESSSINQKSSESSSACEEVRGKFTMAYGFWASMGGFVIDITSLHDDFQRLTLSTSGVKTLIEEGQSLDISEEQIADRSNANALGKFLICIQIVWFLVQALDKLIAGYPLTLLEVHTAIHVVYALIIYALWWHKPQDVDEPILINPAKFESLASFITMSSIPIEKAISMHWLDGDAGKTVIEVYLSTFDTHSKHVRGLSRGPELNALKFNPRVSSALGLTDLQSANDQNPSSAETTKSKAHNGHSPQDSSTTKQLISARSSLTEIKSGTQHTSGFGFNMPLDITIGPKTARRWNLCAHVLVRLGLVDTSTRTIRGSTITHERSPFARLALPYNSSAYLMGESFNVPTVRGDFYFATMLTPMIIGGLHLTAWNLAFPTAIESILWKISALGIALAGPVYIAIAVCGLIVALLASAFMDAPPEMRKFKRSNLCLVNWCNRAFVKLQSKRFLDRATSSTTRYSLKDFCLLVILSLIMIVSLTGWAIFFCFRTYLLVESFISLRRTPVGAFAVTPWVQSIPHL